jgi:ABC-type transporter Mla subunit MlaD
MLDRLPGTLVQVRSTTGILRAVTASATPVVSNLAAAVNELSPAIHTLLPAAQEGTAVVNQLGQTAPELQSTLARLRGLSAPAARALPQVGSVLCQLNPAAKYLSPYSPELAALLQDMGSATNFFDANAHAARLYVTVGEDTLKFLSPPVAAVVHSLLNTGVLGLHDTAAYNPFPAAGNAGETSTPADAAGWASVKARYPRITANC